MLSSARLLVPSCLAFDGLLGEWRSQGCFYVGPRTAYIEGLSRAAQRVTSPAECAALADAGGAREFGLAAGGECWHCAGCSFDKFGRVPDAQQPTLCEPLGNEAAFQLHVREPASCKRRRVVVFAGELRGDGVTWLRLREALVANNHLDVIFDVWQAHAALELLAQELFKPCDWFSEPYEGDWKQRKVARQPRFTLSNNGQLYALSPRKLWHQWDAAYRLWHSDSLVAKHSFDIVVRARLDSHFPRHVSLPLSVPANSVYAHMEWDGIGWEDGEAEPQCPFMLNDMFAYGDKAGMSVYHSVFANAWPLLDAMRAHPGYRAWWDAGVDNVRRPHMFFSNSEGVLGWALRAGNVSCHHVPVNEGGFCLVRKQKSGLWQCDGARRLHRRLLRSSHNALY